jgi:cytidine deaminase
MCGERVALYQAAIRHPGDTILTIAVAVKGKKKLKVPAPPCGACLQVLREFETRQKNRPIRMLLKADADVIWEVPSVAAMLPYSFDGSYL